MKIKINFIVTLFFLFLTILSFAQDQTEYTENTFFANRIINGHSVDLTPAGRLDLKISHRMGRINSGANELFGLDLASFRLGLEYGFNDRLMAGIGRSTVDKLYDGFAKFKIIRQSTGKKIIPLTITGFSSIAVNSQKWTSTTQYDYFASRLYYTFQLLVARKFNEKLSLQISPTLVHRNLVATGEDKNDVFSVGLSGRYKIFSRSAFTFEYFYVLPGQIKSNYNGSEVVNSLSLGFDIYTGKHVFQIFVSNSTTLAEKAFITETTDKWQDGNIHIGFNILRLFNIANK